jgi:hypothetical protein
MAARCMRRVEGFLFLLTSDLKGSHPSTRKSRAPGTPIFHPATRSARREPGCSTLWESRFFSGQWWFLLDKKANKMIKSPIDLWVKCVLGRDL